MWLTRDRDFNVVMLWPYKPVLNRDGGSWVTNPCTDVRLNPMYLPETPFELDPGEIVEVKIERVKK